MNWRDLWSVAGWNEQPMLAQVECSMEQDLRQIVAELTQYGSIRRSGWSAERVGRNRVWRVSSETAAVPRCYVKAVSEREWYERELAGLKVARDLEAYHDWAMAPEVVFTDPTQLALITTALPGRSGNALLRDAYRRDKNVFANQAPIQRFREALRHIISWLQEFHGGMVDRPHVCIDHRSSSVHERVVSKVDRAISEANFRIDDSVTRGLDALSLEKEESEGSLLCGDVSLSNFYWDGARVGRIDFEDIGIGSPSRDFGILRLHIERITGLPWYRQDSELEKILPIGAPGIIGFLHTLEWKLDYYWDAHQRGYNRSRKELQKEIAAMLHSLS